VTSPTDETEPFYERLEGIPPETPIPLTQIGEHGGRYVDNGPGMYCSPEGTTSMRRARTELWAIRHQTRPDRPGQLRFYCRDHLPDREWVAGRDSLTARTDEYTCGDCFLLVREGSTCGDTGRLHTRTAS